MDLPIPSKCRFLGATLLTLLFLVAVVTPASARDVHVFAAASLKNVMEEIATTWLGTSGHRAVVTLAGSSALARQIQHGAPADVFISANAAWMDHLENRNLIDSRSRFDFASNRLILIARESGASNQLIDAQFDLAGRLGSGRLAMAFVNAVPAGMYGKAALESLYLWPTVKDRIAQTDNVRAALNLVATGEAPLGIVYATDAGVTDNISTIGVFPTASHPPIRYPAASVSDSNNPNNTAFLNFLSDDAARLILQRFGFIPIP